MGTKLDVSSSPAFRVNHLDRESFEDEFEYGILARHDDDILDLSFLEDGEIENQWGNSDLESVISSVDGNLTTHAHGNYEDGTY